MKHLLLYICLFFSIIPLYGQSSGSGNALSLDGATQYAEIASPSQLYFKSALTLEVWVYIEDFSTTPFFVCHYTPSLGQNYKLGLTGGSGTVHFNGRNAANTGNWNVSSNTVLSTNTWYHIAGVYDGSTLQLYINGVLDNSAAYTGGILDTDGQFLIGVDQDPSGYNQFLDGKIDEVRIWNKALTADEIRTRMCKKVSQNDALINKLEAYYRMDVAVGNSVNDEMGLHPAQLISSPTLQYSGAPVGDISTYNYGNGNNATVSIAGIYNETFAIDQITGTPDGIQLYAVQETANSNTNNLSGDLFDEQHFGVFIVGGTTPSYSIDYDYSNHSTFSKHAVEPNLRFATRADNSITNWALHSNAFDTDAWKNRIYQCNQSSNQQYIAGLDNNTPKRQAGSGKLADIDPFGGQQQQGIPLFIAPNSDEHALETAITIEVWFYASSLQNTPYLFSRYSSSGDLAYRLAIESGNGSPVPEFTVRNASNSAYNTVFAFSGLEENTWNHITGVYTGTEIQIYINGNFEGSMPHTDDILNSTGGISYLGSDDFGFEALDGNVEDIRIWDTPLDATTLKEWMCKKVTASHPERCNITSYYKFDQGVGDVIKDYVGNADTDPTTLLWKWSSAPIGDESNYSYSLSSGDAISLNAPSGDLARGIVNQENDMSGMHIYYVDTIPNTTTAPIGLTGVSQEHYWGIKTFNQVFFGAPTAAVYTFEMNYNGHPGITDPSSLELAKRDDNADLSWENQSGQTTLNLNQNTLTLPNQSGTEYILATSGSNNSLPLELERFEAHRQSVTDVSLEWQLVSLPEKGKFEVERMLDNESNFKKIGEVVESHKRIYSYIDINPHSAVSYYRLKMIDETEKIAYSSIQAVDNTSTFEITLYPNPATHSIQVLLEGSSEVEFNSSRIQIINLQGQIVLEHYCENSLFEVLPIGHLSKGTYFIQIKNQNNILHTKSFIKS